MINWQHLPSHAEYIEAVPWPHCIVDDFLSPVHVEEINRQWPAESDPHWRREKNKTSIKWCMVDNLPPAAQSAVETLTSPYALNRLSELTGIPNLITSQNATDGGGLHCIPSGGYLKKHIDYNQLKGTQLYRRLNLLLYLNEQWNESWGGELTLYGRINRIVPPVAGRVAIFSTGEHSYHGHPEPLTCPPDVQRRSLALYYYTTEPPADWTGKRHTTVYKR